LIKLTQLLFRLTAILLLFLLDSSQSFSQLSGYASAGMGYYSNPLYSYLMESSPAKQGYAELTYDQPLKKDMLSFKYVGSLSIFDNIQQRNYYEHRLSGNYALVFGKTYDPLTGKNLENDTTSNDNTDDGEVNADTFRDFDDSLFKYLNLNITGGSRINKPAFREFDNWGISMSASYRFMPFNFAYLRIEDNFSFREYKTVSALSNESNTFSLILGNRTAKKANYGLALSFGIKHFIKEFADTLFDQSLYSTDHGNPKGGKIFSGVEDDTTYFQSITEQPDNLIQLTPSVFYKANYGKTEIYCNIHYNKNFQKTSRFINQMNVSTYVNEDLYNESFSFEGLGFAFRIKQLLPLNLQASLNLDFQQKHYGFPAFSLIGETLANSRFDMRTNVDFYLSRYFEVYKNLGLEVTFLSGYYRNQSTDEFNNYYLYYYMLALGIGF